MKKVILLVCMMFFGAAKASVINVDVSNTTPFLGDTVTVNINLNGVMEDFTSLLTALQFDSSIFQYVDGSASSDFGLFDASTFLGLDVDTTLASSGSLFFTLFDDFGFGPVFSMGDYLVASFDLLVVGPGTAAIALLDTSLFTVNDPFNATQATAGVTSVVATAVSAPSVIALFGLAGVALFGFRRKA